jgi:hypothetical protein
MSVQSISAKLPVYPQDLGVRHSPQDFQSVQSKDRGKSCFVAGKAAAQRRKKYTLPILDPGVETGCMFMATFRPIYPRQKDPAPTVQEAEWALWLV